MNTSIKINKIVETTKTEEITYYLNNFNLIDLLRKSGYEIPSDTTVEIYVRVPGGGDWSNENLDIDDNTPIIVSYKNISTELER